MLVALDVNFENKHGMLQLIARSASMKNLKHYLINNRHFWTFCIKWKKMLTLWWIAPENLFWNDQLHNVFQWQRPKSSWIVKSLFLSLMSILTSKLGLKCLLKVFWQFFDVKGKYCLLHNPSQKCLLHWECKEESELLSSLRLNWTPNNVRVCGRSEIFSVMGLNQVAFPAYYEDPQPMVVQRHYTRFNCRSVHFIASKQKQKLTRWHVAAVSQR